MSTRFGWFTAVSLFGAAAALIAAGHPLVAAVLLMLVSYLAGRWDRRQRRAGFLGAEVERRDARIAALEDEQVYHYDRQHAARFAGVDRPRPDWAAVDRKPDTADRGSVPAPSSAITNP